MIPFNKPHLTGKEAHYIYDAVYGQGKLSGNGKYTQLCHDFFQKRYGFKKCLLTTSCTDALEMAALLLELQPGDEVIMPSYTFVSTANAFVLRGAHIRFVDSRADHPGMDEDKVEELITSKTKAIVVVHYAGVACDMDKIMQIADKHGLLVVEDAAQAIDSYYTGVDGAIKPLGGIGHLAAFSFHETKNIQCGEGGMLVVNDDRFAKRAEIIWEKGTNRAAFFRGDVDKYGWVDIGSSFLPSEISASFLYAQLEELDEIQQLRLAIWSRYNEAFNHQKYTAKFSIPDIPLFSTNNAHMFYLVLPCANSRDEFIRSLNKSGINTVFHYQSLHSSLFYHARHDGRTLSNCDHFSDCLVRLPLWVGLMPKLESIIEKVTSQTTKSLG
jgi:dTDP-4-amino-4,6-dideoxygalactose transaminase